MIARIAVLVFIAVLIIGGVVFFIPIIHELWVEEFGWSPFGRFVKRGDK